MKSRIQTLIDITVPSIVKNLKFLLTCVLSTVNIMIVIDPHSFLVNLFVISQIKSNEVARDI